MEITNQEKEEQHRVKIKICFTDNKKSWEFYKNTIACYFCDDIDQYSASKKKFTLF